MDKSPKDELKYLEGKVKQNPNSMLFARLADVYLSLNRVDEAIKLCENGLKKHPQYITGHFIMSKCYRQQNQLDHAEKELKRVLLFDPEYIAAHRDYGDLMAQIGWLSTSESSYEKILEIDPLNRQALQKLSEIRKKVEQEKETEKDLDIELEEFEEEAIVTDDIVEHQKPIEFDETTPVEKAKPVASPKYEMTETIIDEDEEKFSYILDDIFREDSILPEVEEDSHSEVKEEIKDQAEEELEDIFKLETDPELHDSFRTTNIGKSKTIPTIEDDFQSEILEKWLESDKMPAELDKTEKKVAEEKKEKTISSIDRIIDESFKKKATTSQEIEDIFDIEQEPEPIKSNETDFDEKKLPEEKKFDLKKGKEKIVTPTLGEIYTAQHQYAKAIGVYEILRKNNPDNPIYQQKIEYLKKKLEEDRNLGQ